MTYVRKPDTGRGIAPGIEFCRVAWFKNVLQALWGDSAARVIYLNEQEITAFDHAPVGWWTDNLWINGQNVDMPGLSGGETWAGDENGEIVVSEMYRLDQVEAGQVGEIEQGIGGCHGRRG